MRLVGVVVVGVMGGAGKLMPQIGIRTRNLSIPSLVSSPLSHTTIWGIREVGNAS